MSVDADPWQIMDDWCRTQARKLTERSTPFVLKGGSLNDPEYRRWLGQHQAFGRVRSFIHGARSAASCDTHPKDGDASSAAPLVSGAVDGGEADSETPNLGSHDNEGGLG